MLAEVSPLVDSADVGQVLIRSTIWVSLFFYLAAMTWLLAGRGGRGPRLFWTLSCLAFLAHVAAAFHYVHGWSHERAVEHTREGSGFGAGIFVSYFFTLLWSLDVATWWLAPDWHERRPRWLSVTMHAFLAFIIFQGSVVFATGPSRWGGLALFTILGAVVSRRFFAAAKH